MYKTGNPVPSSALEDMADNAQTFDALVTKTEGTTTDRLGRTRRVFQQILMDMGFQPLSGSFQTCATITARNQTLYDEVSHVFYSWGGTIPVGGYIVPAGSTPATTGGIGAGAWIDRTDSTLRHEIYDAVFRGFVVNNAEIGVVVPIGTTAVRNGGVVYYLWDDDFSTSPHTIVSVALTDYYTGEQSLILTDSGSTSFEFLTKGAYVARAGNFNPDHSHPRSTNIAGWGVDLSVETSTIDSNSDGVPDYVDLLVDSSAIFKKALLYCDSVIAPEGNYLLGDEKITLNPNQRIKFAGREVCSVHVTSNAGSISPANSPFAMSRQSSVTGFTLKYPNQLLDENDSNSVLSYPPFITTTNDGLGAAPTRIKLKDIMLEDVYHFFDQSSSSSPSGLYMENIWGNILYRFGYMHGPMGDVSKLSNVHVILNGSSYTSPVSAWCRANTKFFDFNLSAGTRIDGIMLSNCSVISGASIFHSETTGVWIQCDNCLFDICTQIITGKIDRIFFNGGFLNAQDGNIVTRHKPAFELTTGAIWLTGVRVGIQANGAGCMFLGSGATYHLSGSQFFTSRGYITPLIADSGSPVINISGCTITTKSKSRNVSFTDLSVFNPSSITIDGKKSWQRSTSDIVPVSNFNMTSWVGGIPTNWVTNISSGYSSYITQADTGNGVLIKTPAASGSSFYLEYDFGVGEPQLFGCWYFTASVMLLNSAGGFATDGTVDILIGNATDGWNKCNAMIGNGGANAEVSGLPIGSNIYLGAYLPCPVLSSETVKLRLSVNYITAANHVDIKVTNMQLWRMVDYTGTSKTGNITGDELTYEGLGNVRDIRKPDGSRRLKRATVPPSSGSWIKGDECVQVTPTASAVAKKVCSVAGDPGTWLTTATFS